MLQLGVLQANGNAPGGGNLATGMACIVHVSFAAPMSQSKGSNLKSELSTSLLWNQERRRKRGKKRPVLSLHCT
jgi:hypothetical protein